MEPGISGGLDLLWELREVYLELWIANEDAILIENISCEMIRDW